MLPLFYTQHILSNEQIIERLHQLRAHCFAESSGFAVAALLEYSLGESSYVYIGGVNVESATHNRLSIHAEQNALATAQAVLGGDAKFSKLWVMGALQVIQAGSQDAGAAQECHMCGQCRQIALSLSTADAVMYAVTVRGDISVPYPVSETLPLAFSERDLQLAPVAEEKMEAPAVLLKGGASLFKTPVAMQVQDLFSEQGDLAQDKVLKYLRLMKPHMVDSKFKTSAVVACILKMHHDHTDYYVPGVLTQDVAFSTTDAIFAALACAVTQFGANGLKCAEVYLYVDNFNGLPLTGAELDAISAFTSRENVCINVYSKQGDVMPLSLMDCFSRMMYHRVSDDKNPLDKKYDTCFANL